MKKLLILSVLLMGSWAQAKGGAGVYLGLNLFYSSNDTASTSSGVTSTSKSSSTVTDLDLGYVFSSGLYLGIESANESADLGSSKPKQDALGVSIGYFTSGFLGQLSYFISGNKESGTSTKYSEGSGIGASALYLWNVSGSFHLGGGLNYRSIEYKKVAVSGVTLSNSSQKETEIEPRLVFSFLF